MTEAAKTTELKNDCLTLYGAYAAALVMLFFATTCLLGLLLLIIAYIVMLTKRKSVAGTFYATHLRWMNRTLWIGSGFLLLATIVSSLLIAGFTDIHPIIESAMSGNIDALLGGLQGYMDANMVKLYIFSTAPAIPVTVWWLHRCWRGFALLRQDLPVENVTRWL